MVVNSTVRNCNLIVVKISRCEEPGVITKASMSKSDRLLSQVKTAKPEADRFENENTESEQRVLYAVPPRFTFDYVRLRQLTYIAFTVTQDKVGRSGLQD